MYRKFLSKVSFLAIILTPITLGNFIVTSTVLNVIFVVSLCITAFGMVILETVPLKKRVMTIYTIIVTLSTLICIAHIGIKMVGKTANGVISEENVDVISYHSGTSKDPGNYIYFRYHGFKGEVFVTDSKLHDISDKTGYRAKDVAHIIRLRVTMKTYLKYFCYVQSYEIIE